VAPESEEEVLPVEVALERLREAEERAGADQALAEMLKLLGLGDFQRTNYEQ